MDGNRTASVGKPLETVWFGHEPRAEPGFGRQRVCYRGYFDWSARQRIWPAERGTQLLVPRRTSGAGRRDLPSPARRARSAGRGRRGHRHPQGSPTSTSSTNAASPPPCVTRWPTHNRCRAQRADQRPRYGRRRDRGAGDVVAAGRRVVGAAGPHRVSAGVLVGAPGDRVAAVLRRRRGRIVHRGNATRHRGGGAGVLRARHRAHRQGVGHRPVHLRRPQRRLPAGLVRHHRHDPDRVVGPGVQGRNPHGGKESVADRDRI